jgi:hypothetical protein
VFSPYAASVPVPRPQRSRLNVTVVKAEANQVDVEVSRRSMLGAAGAALATSLPVALPQPVFANTVVSSDWESVCDSLSDLLINV